MKRITAYVAAVLLAFGALASLAGAGWMAWGWLGGYDATPALVEHGIETTGRVKAVQISAGQLTQYGQLTSARYFVTYTFTDAAGHAHEAVTSGLGKTFAFRIGDDIPVRYLPERPEVNAFTGAGNATGKAPVAAIALVAIGGLLCAHGAWSMIGSVRGPGAGSRGTGPRDPRRGATARAA